MSKKNKPDPRQKRNITHREKIFIRNAVRPYFEVLTSPYMKEGSPLARELMEQSMLRTWRFGYLGKDMRVVEKYDDEHPIALPLRINSSLKNIKHSIDVLFHDLGNHPVTAPASIRNVKQEIYGFILRAQREKKIYTRIRTETKKVARYVVNNIVYEKLAYYFFVDFVGETLRSVLIQTVDGKKRWGSLPTSELRLNPDTVAWLVRDLFKKVYGVELRSSEETLKKRFQRILVKGELLSA